MKVMGFAIIVLGLVMIYIGMTGSQHNIMAIIKNGPAAAGGQNINTSGSSGSTSTGNNSGSSGGTTPPGSGSVPPPGSVGLD